MNINGKAYSELQMVVEDWGNDHPNLVRHPETFGRHVADLVFNELLDITKEEIETED